jgi:hypothetical protein
MFGVVNEIEGKTIGVCRITFSYIYICKSMFISEVNEHHDYWRYVKQ